MKKSAMLGVVGAFGVAWTGMAWYSGYLAETFFVQSVRNVNERLTVRAESWHAIDRVELMSYERGVFSSTARYRIRLGDWASQGIPGQERDFFFVSHAQHGPFPLFNLIAGKVMPAMAAGRYALEDTAAAKGALPLSGSYSVTYLWAYIGMFGAPRLQGVQITPNLEKIIVGRHAQFPERR